MGQLKILELRERAKQALGPKFDIRAFHAQVPMLAQWDDHEVTNDWSPIGSMR